jgi:hypothetical protein
MSGQQPIHQLWLRGTAEVRAEAHVIPAAFGGEPDASVEVPRFGELLLCIFIAPERQKERLGCFEERFREWEEKYGARIARWLYVGHALRSAWDIVRIGVVGAILDWLWDQIGRER